MWEKEKMLVTSIFSFSHNVFKENPKENFCFLGHTYFVVCKCFQVGPVLKLSFGKELSLYLIRQF